MNLNTTIDFDVKRFFLWWGRELSYWLPENLRQKLSDKSGYVLLSATEEKLTFARIIDDQQQTVAELAFNENNSEQYQHLMTENAELEKAKVILRLSADQAIKKILYLPAATKENLRQVVEFEMDRYTPFNAEQVYFAVKILGKEENGQIKALLVVTPKEILDAIYQQLKKIPMYPDMVDYEKAANNFTDDLDPYNLLPEWERPEKNKITKTITWVSSFVLLILSVAVLVLPVWYQSQTVESLRHQLTLLEKDSRVVQTRQLEIDNIIDETERLIQSKNRAPSLTELINMLSLLIKDDTWLTHLQFRDGRLQLQGQSPTASALIGVLEAAPIFNNARFVSPLTQDKRTGLERFQISVDVKVPEDSDE